MTAEIQTLHNVSREACEINTRIKRGTEQHLSQFPDRWIDLYRSLWVETQVSVQNSMLQSITHYMIQTP